MAQPLEKIGPYTYVYDMHIKPPLCRKNVLYPAPNNSLSPTKIVTGSWLRVRFSKLGRCSCFLPGYTVFSQTSKISDLEWPWVANFIQAYVQTVQVELR